MTLFALMHGGLHNGSSWDLVADGLVARGHQVVAPDLPVDDDAAGAMEWARVVVAAIDRVANDVEQEDVVVVGHSISGLCLPVVAALRPVRRMVFVAALVPVPGETFAAEFAANPRAVSFPAPQTMGEGPFGLTWNRYETGSITIARKPSREKPFARSGTSRSLCSSSDARSTSGRTYRLRTS